MAANPLTMLGRVEREPCGGEMWAAMALAILALNGLASYIAASTANSANGAMLALGGISAVIWFALFVMIRLALDAPAGRFALPSQDRFAVAAAIMLALAPLKEAALVGLVGLSLYFLVTSSIETPRRRIALIAVALTGPVVWGPVFKALFGNEITAVEAFLLSGLPGVFIDGNVINAADGVTRLVVAGGCSAIANISLALLLTVTLAQVAGVRRMRSMVGWALAAMASVVVVNSARLAALGYYPENFAYLHEGTGRSLFVNAAFAAMVIIALVGVHRVSRREA